MKKQNPIMRLTAMLLVGLMLLSACAPAEPVPPETEDEAVQETLPQTETEAETETETEAATESETEAETESETEAEFLPEELMEARFPDGVQAKTVYFMTLPKGVPVRLALASLQGLAARYSENQIILQVGAASNYLPYLEQWGCTVERKIDGKAITVETLAAMYQKEGFIKGYILCPGEKDEKACNVAVSLAGVLDAVVVTEETKGIFENLGYTCLLDTTGKDDAWLRSSEYWDLLSRDVALSLSATQAVRLIDFAIKCGAYVSFQGNSTQKMKDTYEFLHENAIVMGGFPMDEYAVVDTLSRLHLHFIPADHAYNVSTLSGFRTPTLKQKEGPETESTEPKNVHTVTFVMSDGDNMQWVLNNFYGSQSWFGSRKRGSFPMGWGLPATSIETMSPMLALLYDQMTEQDEFLMQVSGLGYTFPSRWEKEARIQMAQEVAGYMKRSDMPYMEILDEGSMYFNEDVLEDFTAQDGIEGIFWIDYANYSGGKGKIIWTNGKPTVSARYCMWGDTSEGNLKFLSSRINKNSTDPMSEDSYSFIIVHCWSGLKDGKFTADGNTMDGIHALIEMLDEDVEVVTPSEFMRRIKTNLGEGK